MKSKFKGLIFTILLLGLGIYKYGLEFLVPVLAISFLIFFHELGHFLAAKQLGVCVDVFSIGFGEEIYSKKIKNTIYKISAIPLGGYVSLKGQVDIDPTAKSEDLDSYTKLSPFGRIYILFAGPFFNLFLAFLIYIALGFIGVDKLAPKIGFVGKNSPALNNIDVNDTILSINGVKISHWDEISPLVGFSTLNLQIKKNNGEIKSITLTPKIGETKTIFGEKIKKPLIGISPNGEIVRIYHTGFSSLKFALDETIKASKLIFVSLQKLIQRVVSPTELGGIVIMTDIMTKAYDLGISTLLVIMALISVNLGIVNLFPIPALDGGHIMFNLYELIFKRPVNDRIFATLSYAGIGFLFALMAFTIINDILRLSGAYN